MSVKTLVLAWFPDGCWGIGETAAEARANAMELRRRDDAPPCGWEAWEARLDCVQVVGLTRVVRAVLQDLKTAEGLPWPEAWMKRSEEQSGEIPEWKTPLVDAQRERARELAPDEPTADFDDAEELDVDEDEELDGKEDEELDVEEDGDDPEILASMEADLTRGLAARAEAAELMEAWRALNALDLSPWAWVGVVAQACDYTTEVPLRWAPDAHLLLKLRVLCLLAETRRPAEWVQLGVAVALSPVELAPDEELAQVIAQRLTERALKSGPSHHAHLVHPQSPARDKWLKELGLWDDELTRWHCSRLLAEWNDELHLIAPDAVKDASLSLGALWARVDAAWLREQMTHAAHDVGDAGVIFMLLRDWGPRLGWRWAAKLGRSWAQEGAP